MLVPGKLSFVIIFTNMMVLWLSWFALCFFDPFRIDLNKIIRFGGLSLAGAGVVIFLTALFTIKRWKAMMAA